MVKTGDEDEDGGQVVQVVYHDDGGEQLGRGEHWTLEPEAERSQGFRFLPPTNLPNPQLLAAKALLWVCTGPQTMLYFDAS